MTTKKGKTTDQKTDEAMGKLLDDMYQNTDQDLTIEQTKAVRKALRILINCKKREEQQ